MIQQKNIISSMQIMVLVAKQFETTTTQYIITRVSLNQTEKGTISSLKVNANWFSSSKHWQIAASAY